MKAKLLARLRKGQTWLMDTNEQLLAMPGLGRGTDLEKQFLAGLDLWDELEFEMRSQHGHRGCIGQDDGEGRCPDAAIVSCMACERVEERW